MTDIRVLWLTKGLGRGGAEMLLVSLARAMDRDGLRIDAAYQHPQKTALVEELEAAGVRVWPVGRGSSPWPVQLRRRLREDPYDVVHTHAPLVGAAARLVAPPQSTLVHTEHNVWGRFHPATRMVNALTIGHNAMVWAVSDQVAESIRPPWPIRRPPVEVMLHGVDLVTVRSGPDARAAARRRLGLDSERFVFGTVGNLAAKKDQATMLRAFARVHEQARESVLVVVGTGPRHADLRALAKRLRIEQSVQFLGMRDDVPELLPAFDVFVLSSVYEGLSIALVEALAAGVPVVATDVGGIPQLIANGVHGVLVPPSDVASLEEAMTLMLHDAGLRQRLAVAGPQRAAKFGIQSAADALGAHYRELATRDHATVVGA